MKPYFAARETGRTMLIGRTYDVAADGRFFLIKEPAGGTVDVQTVAVIEHWIDEVKKKLGQ